MLVHRSYMRSAASYTERDTRVRGPGDRPFPRVALLKMLVQQSQATALPAPQAGATPPQPTPPTSAQVEAVGAALQDQGLLGQSKTLEWTVSGP